MLFSKSKDQQLRKVITWIRSFKINIPLQGDEINTIRKLDLSFKNISKLPPEIGCLENLTEINLSYNNLKSLPKELKHISNLHLLNLGYNQYRNGDPGINHSEMLKLQPAIESVRHIAVR